MSTKPDGGPAFPLPTPAEWIRTGPNEGYLAAAAYQGMTLRDYFAGQALAGFAAHGGLNILGPRGMSSSNATVAAYEIADAMLSVRTK